MIYLIKSCSPAGNPAGELDQTTSNPTRRRPVKGG
jgi:hypothetical protein